MIQETRWKIVVQRIVESSAFHINTVEIHEGYGWNTHDETIQALLKQYKDDGDIRIVGPGHMTYKEESKMLHPVWYFG